MSDREIWGSNIATKVSEKEIENLRTILERTRERLQREAAHEGPTGMGEQFQDEVREIDDVLSGPLAHPTCTVRCRDIEVLCAVAESTEMNTYQADKKYKEVIDRLYDSYEKGLRDFVGSED